MISINKFLFNNNAGEGAEGKIEESANDEQSTIPSERGITTSMKEETPVEIPDEGKDQSKAFHPPYDRDMKEPSRKNKDSFKPYKCGICDRRFLQVGSLSLHMKSHTGETMPYECEACGMGFTTMENLRLHSKIHTGNKPYQCEHCEKKFARGGQLMAHRRVHIGDKRHSCPSCDLTFTSMGNLRTHQKLHIGSRKHQCHLCKKTYRLAERLKVHILTDHENKPVYKCDVCGESFKGHVKEHMRIHTEDRDVKPYGCNQCGARFSQRSQLTVHMRIHTGERPYICKICSRNFLHSTALRLHMRMHTREKPHSCKLCKRPFSQLPHLKKHMLSVHGTDKPYFCEKCESFFKSKIEYRRHVGEDHPNDVPKDLLGGAGFTEATTNKTAVAPCDAVIPLTTNSLMPLPKMRMQLALLLKKISAPRRLKKLGFGTRLIDEVLRESIQASGRTPCLEDENLGEYEVLKRNIQILLEWTVPAEYMRVFISKNKSVEDILEELGS